MTPSSLMDITHAVERGIRRDAMSPRWINRIRRISVASALVTCATVVSASAQTVWIPPRPTIAYTVVEWGVVYPPCPEDGRACNGGGPCCLPVRSVIATPFGETSGPWDSG